MAKAHGKKARVYVSGLDISTYLKGASTGGSQDLADSTGLGTDDKEFLVGMQDGKISLDGMFAASAGEEGDPKQIADVLEEALGQTPLAVVHLPQGDGFGNRAKLVDGNQSSVEISTPYSDVGKMSGEISSNVGLKSGQVLHPKEDEVEGEDNSLGLDGTEKSEAGGLGVLEIFAVDEGATLEVTIQHSADNETFVDLIAFTPVEAGELAEAKMLSASAEVKRYVRALWVLSGGGASFHTSFARN